MNIYLDNLDFQQLEIRKKHLNKQKFTANFFGLKDKYCNFN